MVMVKGLQNFILFILILEMHKNCVLAWVMCSVGLAGQVCSVFIVQDDLAHS